MQSTRMKTDSSTFRYHAVAFEVHFPYLLSFFLFFFFYAATQQPNLGPIEDLPPAHKHLVNYYKIARHFKWALSQMFDVLMFDQIIVMEGKVACTPPASCNLMLHTVKIQTTLRSLQTFSCTFLPCCLCSKPTQLFSAFRPGTTMASLA